MCTVVIDGLDEIPSGERNRVAAWLVALRKDFPLTPVVVCHRQYSYRQGLLPFPVVVLQKVEANQACQYIKNYLRVREVRDHEKMANQLIKLLLDNPDHAQIRDLAQTPLFLWMIVKLYCEKQELPKNRAQLFAVFAKWHLDAH